MMSAILWAFIHPLQSLSTYPILSPLLSLLWSLSPPPPISTNVICGCPLGTFMPRRSFTRGREGNRFGSSGWAFVSAWRPRRRPAHTDKKRWGIGPDITISGAPKRAGRLSQRQRCLSFTLMEWGLDVTNLNYFPK